MDNMIEDPIQSASNGVERPFVLLWHAGGPIEDHVDWLCATDPAGDHPLQTWRLVDRLDALAEGDETEATPLPPHRSRYLDYEGPVSDGRGTVRRLAAGMLMDAPVPIADGTLLLRWTTGPEAGRSQRLRVVRHETKSWKLVCEGWSG